MENALSPIVLFVYNRPWHTKQTLEALAKNRLADQSHLFIYSDGLKNGTTDTDKENIAQVKKLIRSKQWCKEVEIIERERNWGLADNIVDGVTSVVNKFGKVVVLEDDIVTSVGFLQYMNDALNLYENEDKVMHVSGYMFPVKENLPETFFYNTASCWGWGTWERAWSKLIMDTNLLLDEIQRQDRKNEFDHNQDNLFSRQLMLNKERKIKTWAIFWYASVFINRGLCLHPFPSLVQNIGHDGSGVHNGNKERYFHAQLAEIVSLKNIDLKENIIVRNVMLDFYQYKSSEQDRLLSRARKKISTFLKR